MGHYSLRAAGRLMTQHISQTPLKSVRGLGSAKEGVRHFIHQRVSALVLAVLLPYFLYSAFFALGSGYEAARAWVAAPWNTLILLALLGAGAYHMRLGMQVVAEDYTGGALRHLLLILNHIGSITVFAVGAFAVLRIAFGVGA